MHFLVGLLNEGEVETVDFYGQTTQTASEQTGSIVPFLGFMMSLVGILILVVGFARYYTAKKRYDLFYDQRDSVNMDEKKKLKEMKMGKILMIIAVVLIIASFIVL